MSIFKAIYSVLLLGICLAATHSVNAQVPCALASDEIQNVFYVPQIGHGCRRGGQPGRDEDKDPEFPGRGSRHGYGRQLRG